MVFGSTPYTLYKSSIISKLILSQYIATIIMQQFIYSISYIDIFVSLNSDIKHNRDILIRQLVSGKYLKKIENERHYICCLKTLLSR